MFHLALHGHTSIVFVIAVVCLLLSGWGLVKMDLKGIGWPPDSQLSAVALCGGGFFAAHGVLHPLRPDVSGGCAIGTGIKL